MRIGGEPRGWKSSHRRRYREERFGTPRTCLNLHGVVPHNFAQRRDPVLRSARMVHLLALGAITDGQVDVAELEAILGAARYYAESSPLESLE